MSCLFHLFSCSSSSHPPPIGPRLPPCPLETSPKPTFCIYDSEEEKEKDEEKRKTSPPSPFPLLDSFSLPHPSLPPISLLEGIRVQYTSSSLPSSPPPPYSLSTISSSLPSLKEDTRNSPTQQYKESIVPRVHLHLHH